MTPKRQPMDMLEKATNEGVVSNLETAGFGGGPHGKLVAIDLSQDGGAGRLEPGYAGGIEGRLVAFQDQGPCSRCQALRAQRVLQEKEWILFLKNQTPVLA